MRQFRSQNKDPEIEDISHVLFECQNVKSLRESMIEICRKKGFAETIRNCFTRKELQIPTEKLILKFLFDDYA